MCSTVSLWNWTPAAHSTNLISACVLVFLFHFCLTSLIPSSVPLKSPPIEAIYTQILVLGSVSGRTKWRQGLWAPVFLWASVFKMSYYSPQVHGWLSCADPSDLCACVLYHAANGCIELRPQAKVCVYSEHSYRHRWVCACLLQAPVECV